MTIAQQLEQKGIQKGIQLGWQEGRNEGKLEVARTMLQNGIDHNTAMKITGLTEDDLAQIRHCSPFPGSANTGGQGGTIFWFSACPRHLHYPATFPVTCFRHCLPS